MAPTHPSNQAVNSAGHVEIPIVFSSGGATLVGRVYRRAGDLTERQPAVLVTGSWLTVKEQMAHVYATALAARGYTAVTFDFTGWGQSGGDLRHAEVPSRKIADITAAARFVSTLSMVHPDRVGHLGVCASAQYVLTALAQGAPIRSFASVAGWYHDTSTVAPFYGGAEGVQMRLRRAQAALNRYLRTGEVVMVPAHEEGNDRAGMPFPFDYYTDPGRGAVPAWANEMAELSWSLWLTFDGLSPAPVVSVPTLFVHADGCALPDNLKQVSSRVSGPSRVEWSDGDVTQGDFYDQPAQVAFAVEAADDHFRSTLTG